MPHTKPLQITTSTHAMSLSVYAATAVIAVWNLTDVANAIGMTTGFGQVVTDVWSVATLIGAVLAIVGAVAQSRPGNPTPAMRLEAGGAALIGALSLFYLLSLVQEYGWLSSATTQTYAACFGLGGLARTGQIAVEVRRVRRALAARQTTTTIADPAATDQ